VSAVFSLGEVVRPNRPRVKPESMPDAPFIGMEHVEAHTMKLLGTVPAASMKSSAVHFKPGDVLYGRLRPYLNKVFRPTFEGLCSAEFIVFPENERIDGRYLQYFLNSGTFVRFATHLNAGDRPRVDFDQIAPYKIPVPPVERQREIVAELEKQFSRLDEAVANLQRVKANLKRYKASVLKAAVEGRLVETEASLAHREGRTYETGEQLLQRILEERRAKWSGRRKFSEPDAPMVDAALSIPDGWYRSAIPQIANIASGNTPPGILDLVKPAGDVPWFKVGDMNHVRNQQSMAHADAWLTNQQVGELGLRVFPPQTVIFPKRGGAIATNKKRLLSSYGACDLNVMGITPFDEVAPYFFLWFEGIDLAKLSDGSNIPQINNKDIVPLIVPLPPLAEQNRIVAEVDRHLSIIREVEAEVDANLLRAQALRQATLSKAFSTSAPMQDQYQ
jgi:type I restriction enzyme S subunit